MIKHARNRLKKRGELSMATTATDDKVVAADRADLRCLYENLFNRFAGRPQNILDHLNSLSSNVHVQGFLSFVTELLGDSHDVPALGTVAITKLCSTSQVRTHFRYPLYRGDLEEKLVGALNRDIATFHVLRFLYAIAVRAHVKWAPLKNPTYSKRKLQYNNAT